MLNLNLFQHTQKLSEKVIFLEKYENQFYIWDQVLSCT